MELQARLNEIQNQYAHVKRELDATTQKLGSSMHSIKTFWSPELKKERALRKEEAAKYALLSDQLKILRSENQVSQTSKNKKNETHSERDIHSSLVTHILSPLTSGQAVIPLLFSVLTPEELVSPIFPTLVDLISCAACCLVVVGTHYAILCPRLTASSH
jgi:ELKS/RAB6-interacting/CAST family protein 1